MYNILPPNIVISAKKMTLGEYAVIRDWHLSSNEDVRSIGYLVSNDLLGAIWLPEDYFETAYKKTGKKWILINTTI